MRSRNSGPRSNAWSQSKYTNQNAFEPQILEWDRAYARYSEKWTAQDGIFIAQMPLHPDFIMPVSVDEVRDALSSVPIEFTAGLEAVILFGGNESQKKASSKFAYGWYMFCKVIVLHAYPRENLRIAFRRGLRPSEMIEFNRAGAKISTTEAGDCVEFDESALKDFYLRDVLIHEVGHHADRQNIGRKTHRKAEGFANWFATEYRRRGQI